MCRFTVRQPGGSQPSPRESVKLEVPLDLDTLFEDGTGGLDANDLELLALFNNNHAVDTSNESSAAPKSDAVNTIAVGQALLAPQDAAPALAVPAAPAVAPAVVPSAAHDPVQQLQMQAVMQHQAAILQNPQAYPAAAQMYQQALLAQQQQILAAQQQAVVAAAMPGMPAAGAAIPVPSMLGKRCKTQEEADAQTERVKKRRRESAQRSRQRKNAYMKSLEMENRALKLENERLRIELSKSGGSSGGGDGTAAPAPQYGPASTSAPKASSGSVSRQEPSRTGDCSTHQADASADPSNSDGEYPCDPLLLPSLSELDFMPSAELFNMLF